MQTSAEAGLPSPPAPPPAYVEDVLVGRDEFGPLGGGPGSDNVLRAQLRGTAAVSVGREPGGVPAGVLAPGGGSALAAGGDPLRPLRSGGPQTLRTAVGLEYTRAPLRYERDITVQYSSVMPGACSQRRRARLPVVPSRSRSGGWFVPSGRVAASRIALA